MKLRVVTIAYQSMPFITWHLPLFLKTNLDWHWYMAEGAAMNLQCTRWCRPQKPGHSTDGTLEYLYSGNPHLTPFSRQRWKGKLEMFNTLLAKIDESCILLEIDADEVWEPWQLEALVRLFEECPDYDHAMFYCNYFVGDRIAITSRNRYGNKPGEWIRAWRFEPGLKFISHEPPVLSRQERCIPREVTESRGLVFNHYSWVSQEQVHFKEQFYGYEGAVEGWKRLQANEQWPVKELKDFLSWVGDNVEANKI